MQIITFFGGQVYTNEATGGEANRLSFAGEYLDGDASLLISDLLLTDSGEYNCKVKSGGKYQWSQVNLIVLGECCQTHCFKHTQAALPSKPICTNTHTTLCVCMFTHTHADLVTGSLAWHISSVMLTDLMIHFDSDRVI